MIIEGLLNVIYKIIDFGTKFIDIPNLPSNIHNYLEYAFTYIQNGIGILSNFTHIKFLLVMFALIVSIDIGIGVYHFVMWILRKIPVVSIS